MNKVLIIGSGPAGVTCALYLKRAGIDIRVIGGNNSSLNNAKIDNVYGYLESDGSKLFNYGLEQLKINNINYINDEVISLEYLEKGFKVNTLNDSYECEYLVLATGNSSLPNKFSKFIGKGVSICAHCDGPLYRNKPIYVTGEEKYLKHIINDLYLYSYNINIIDYSNIKELVGEDHLEYILMNDNSKIDIRNIFLGYKVTPSTLFYNLGIKLDNEYIKVDENYQTNVDKVYGIGDLVNDIHQVNSACYHGMKAGLDIIKRVKHG